MENSNTPFTIRLATEADVPGILDIYAPYIKQSAITFEFKIPSQTAFWQRIQTVLAEAPWLVCTKGDAVSGYAYASKHRIRDAYRWTRELSVYIHPEHSGKGIATALYVALIELLKIQGYTNALGGIVLPNEVSVHLHQKVGFRRIGVYHQVGFKLGQYWDVEWWELPLRSEPAGEIQPLEDVLGTNAWKEAVAKGLKRLKI